MKNIENWNFLYIKIRQNGYVARDFGSCCNHGEHLHRGHHGALCIWQSNSWNCKFLKNWRSFEIFHFSCEIEDESWQTLVNLSVFTNFYALLNFLLFSRELESVFQNIQFSCQIQTKNSRLSIWRIFSPIFLVKLKLKAENNNKPLLMFSRILTVLNLLNFSRDIERTISYFSAIQSTIV